MTKTLAAAISLLSLAACLLLPILFFLGRTDELTMKTIFLIASAVWLAAATVWFRERAPEQSDA